MTIIHKQDLIEQNLVGHGIDRFKKALQQEKAFHPLLDVRWNTDISFGLSLLWPSNLSIKIAPASQIVLSFHTEQIDYPFIKSVAAENPHSDIVVFSDERVYPSSLWPENVRFFRYLTWHHQIENLMKVWGRPPAHRPPARYSISALSFRSTQFKTYIIGTLLNHQRRDDFLLSWHIVPGYSTDVHAWKGTGRDRLDQLANRMIDQPEIKIDDWYNLDYNFPMQNADWNQPAYRDCVFNITNESWHYSSTLIDDTPFIFPGPLFTEKTWKPLLVGNGILYAGQFESYISLKEVGFQFDYGIDLSYDSIEGDLDRVCLLLDAVEKLADMSIPELEECSRESSRHNQDHILSGDFSVTCDRLNTQFLGRLK